MEMKKYYVAPEVEIVEVEVEVGFAGSPVGDGDFEGGGGLPE